MNALKVHEIDTEKVLANTQWEETERGPSLFAVVVLAPTPPSFIISLGQILMNFG